jgi:phosphatidate cytidylyltransferase
MPDGIVDSAECKGSEIMKTRVITGVVSAVLFLAVLLSPWTALLTALVSVICGVAVYEVLNVCGLMKYRAPATAAILFSVIAPWFSRMNGGFVFLSCLIYVLALAVLWFLQRQTFSVAKTITLCFTSAFVSLSLSCISYLRTASRVRDSDGLFYVFLALLIAWMADTGAYFVGTFFGKHKLCPRLSPKKTVEGLIGGIAISILICLLAGLIYESAVVSGEARVAYGEIFVLALIGAPLSVVGDLFASLIKRRHGVKDYGKIFPGHGGVMDRFDSLLFVLPVVYWVVSGFPLVYHL